MNEDMQLDTMKHVLNCIASIQSTLDHVNSSLETLNESISALDKRISTLEANTKMTTVRLDHPGLLGGRL